jgi:uncharacterized protein YpmB
MVAIAIFLSVFMAIFVAIFIPFMATGKRYRAEQEKARERRLVDAKMNARLLRMNL